MQTGNKYLITTEGWFFAPDGENYRSAFGTVHGVIDSTVALGIKTNARSTNWYVVIGDMLIAGCQIHYAMRADTFNPEPGLGDIEHNGARHIIQNSTTRIYDADKSGLIAHC